MNQDGRSSSLTAPNGLAQSAVIHAAMLKKRKQETGKIFLLTVTHVVFLLISSRCMARGHPLEIQSKQVLHTMCFPRT